MNTGDLYLCLAESDRLRIVNLLAEGPLCGCHIQNILALGQVKISKQLAYLKKLGAVDCDREANWVVYRLSEPVDPLLAENLRLLRLRSPELAEDLKRRSRFLAGIAHEEKPAPEPVQKQCCIAMRFCHEKHNKDTK